MRDWLIGVLTNGESHQHVPPVLLTQDRAEVMSVLRSAFDRHSLDVGGPALAFDSGSALSACLALARACWRLAANEDKENALNISTEPISASAHLSVDVTLRYLPAVYRRARLRREDDSLADEIEALLRRWPLSGVLSDLDGRPTTEPAFDGHSGLQMLYAERLLVHGRTGWLPADTRAREWVEHVYQERGKSVPVVKEPDRE